MVEWKKLGDVCCIYDGTHQTPHYMESGVKFVSVENIDNLYNTNKYISEKDYSDNYKNKPRKGDVLMTRIGDVGRCAIITKDEPIAYYVSLALLRPKKEEIFCSYLKHLLESRTGRIELRKRTLLTAVPLKINLGEIGKIKIPIPSLSEQNRIVGILDAFTDSIENLKQQIAQRRKQFEFYRDQLLDLKGKERVEMKTLGEIGKCCAGATPSTKIKAYWDGGIIPWMSSGEIHQGIVKYTSNFITQLGYNNSSTKMLPINTVVIALAGQGKTRGTVAITNIDLCTNQSLCGVIINRCDILNKYIYYYLKTRYQDLRRVSSGDGTRGGLNLKMIASYKFPYIPLSEQQRIVSILDTFEASISNLEAQLAQRQKQYEYYRNKLLTFD